MTPEAQTKLQQHLQEIAKILDREAETQKLESLEGIEENKKKADAKIYHTATGSSLSIKTTGTKAGRVRVGKGIIGELPISETQAVR